MLYLRTFETFKHKIIMENKVEYKFGCVMADIKFDGWQSILDSIDLDDLVEDDNKKQLEEDPHITILYGIHETVCKEDIQELFKDIKTINITLTGISAFENDDKTLDVIKYDLESEDLKKMNKIIADNCDYTDTLNLEYNPHITIAYTKKGRAKKYIKKLNTPLTLELDTIVFSAYEGGKTKFKL